MTTRRTILQGLAALPVAAVPAIVPDRANAASPDAALIAFAATVEALALESNAIMNRQCDLQAVYDDTRHPERPTKPVHIDRVERKRQYAEALEAWEARSKAVREEIGLAAVEELYDDCYSRLEDAVLELTPMVATTLTGLIAKARVSLLMDPDDSYSMNDWEHALRASVLRDLLSIGGVA